MHFVDNSSDMTKQFQPCNSLVTSALKEDRNEAVYKSTSNFSSNSVQSYPKLPVDFPQFLSIQGQTVVCEDI